MGVPFLSLWVVYPDVVLACTMSLINLKTDLPVYEYPSEKSGMLVDTFLSFHKNSYFYPCITIVTANGKCELFGEIYYFLRYMLPVLNSVTNCDQLFWKKFEGYHMFCEVRVHAASPWNCLQKWSQNEN